MKRCAKEWRERNWQRRKLRDTWKGMINRCHRPEVMRRWANASQVPKPRDYAGAGVKVCERWRGDGGFERFCRDVGPPPTPKHTLDRKRCDRGYTPSNVRWADPKLQARNRKNACWLEALDPKTHERVTLSLSEWERYTGISRRTITARLQRGWTPDRAVGTPTQDPTLPF